MRRVAAGREGALDVDARVNVMGARSRQALGHQRLRQVEQLGMAADDPDRLAGDGADRAGAEVAQQLLPDLGADIGADRGGDAGPLEGGRDRLDPPRYRAVGLAQREPVERSRRVADHPGLDHRVGRIDHAADDLFEPDGARQRTLGIEKRQVRARQPIFRAAIEIPPRDAVNGEDDAGLRPDQRRQHGRGRRQHGGFQRHEDDVLNPQTFGPVGHTDAGVEALLADPQGEAARLDRGELSAAGYRRDLDARRLSAGPEPGRDMTADCSGAEHDYLHSGFPYRLDPN